MLAAAGRWSFWGRMLAVAQLALLAKRHIEKLEPGEPGELATIVRKSRGRPGNLTGSERQRLSELVRKLEPSMFARSAASTAVPLRRKR